MKKFRRLTMMVLAVLIFLRFLAFTYFVKAAENDIEVIGKIYEFEEKSEYEISSAKEKTIAENNSTLGKLFVSGPISKVSTKDGISVYEIEDEKLINFSYIYDNSLLTANITEWHLIEDNKKVVDGIKLDDKIGNGAIIVQTSLDGKKWNNQQICNNLVQDTGEESFEKIFHTKDIELINGCYYRVIVVYKLEMQTNITKILFVDTADFECKKYAEVYEFYACYKNSESGMSDKEKRYSLGNLVNTGKDNGYSGFDNIEGDDPHYGWELGNFFVSGYTEKNDEMVFLKNVGDKITLWFNLKEDIDQLHGNKDLRIVEDKDGYDQQFQTPKINFGRGALIIQYTDYEGIKHEPVIYENYLEALTSAGADVRVRFFEEGDYKVALDYKLKNTKGIPKTYDYRISFDFKVRNGNCMVYPFDVITKSELTDSSVTENGFYLDLARSRYLKINVKMARWTKGANGYVEDVRYNRPAKDGDEYIEEGIYTIEVNNPSTGKVTEKKIYVGTDHVLKASMKADNSVYSINEISKMVEQGARIEDDGTIVLPTAKTENRAATENTDEVIQTIKEQNQENQNTEISVSALAKTEDEKDPALLLFGIGVVAVCGICVVGFGIIKKKS